MTAKSYTELEQFDNELGDYDSLSAIPDDYRYVIGDFIIVFSALEHVLNLIISDLMSDRAHDLGYRVVSRLSVREKIDFLYETLLNFIAVTEQDKKDELKELFDELRELKTYRNKIVHANWETLKTNGAVRTKILSDKTQGFIKFENVEVTIEGVKKMIVRIDNSIALVDNFFMEAQNNALKEKEQ